VSTKNCPGLNLLSTDNTYRLGRESRDMGLFKDDDGKGYLLTEDVCVVVSWFHEQALTVNSETTASASSRSRTTTCLPRRTCIRGSSRAATVSKRLP
jgi:hypothetical protein